MKTLAQVIFETTKPNLTFEQFCQSLIDSGKFTEDSLNLPPANIVVEDRRRKIMPSITPRVANWAGHDQIRYMIKSDVKIRDIIYFLAIVLYERMQKAGGGLNAELVEKWRDKVDPLLDELHLDEAVKVSLEWFKKAISLGELNSKAMKAYLNTKTRGSKPEEVENTEISENSSFFPEEEV